VGGHEIPLSRVHLGSMVRYCKHYIADGEWSACTDKLCLHTLGSLRLLVHAHIRCYSDIKNSVILSNLIHGL